MSVLVGRPINGISINGLEYLLDPNNYPAKFEDASEAKQAMRNLGFEEKDVEDYFVYVDLGNDD